MVGGSDRYLWRQSTYCSSGGCVEVAEADVDGGGVVLVRSTEDPERVMATTRPAWVALIEAIRADELTPPPSAG